MATPPKKQSVDERATYLKDPARLGKQALLADLNQRRLKQEQISLYKDSREKQKRKHNNNDDLSVVSAADHPKELQGRNNFDTSTFWTIPKH